MERCQRPDRSFVAAMAKPEQFTGFDGARRTARYSPAQARRLAEANQARDRGSSGGPESAASECASDAPDLRQMDGGPQSSHHCPCDGKPDLAGVFREWPGGYA